MTRHAWHPGMPENMGAHYFRIDPDGELRELEPDEVRAALDAAAERRDPAAPAKSEPGWYWSPWLEWRGGPCPLPPRADVQCEYWDGSDGAAFAVHFGWKHHDNHADIIRFRYASRDRLGWLDFDPEKWTPPDALFEPDCPVMLEWAVDVGHEFVTGFNRRADWGGVHYVRLVAREQKAGPPEGWMVHHVRLVAREKGR